MTFKELYFKGEIPFEEIDRYTSRWNFSDETCTLAQYLGLNDEEEDVWISQSDEALEELLEKEKAAYASCKTKILFTDLDGTLLNDDKEISAANKEAIHQALNAGHKVVLTSGRALHHVLPIADALEIHQPGCYIIAYNGAQIYDYHKNRMMLRQTLSYEDVEDIFEEAGKAGIYCQTYDEEGNVLASRDCEELQFYVRSAHAEYKIIDDVPSNLTKEPCKVLFIDLFDHQQLDEFRIQLNEKYKNRFYALFSSQYYMEVIQKDVSKGNALHFLANYLNIPMTNTVAVGDYDNDLPMIKEAAIGIILANGPEHVKAQADYITENDNNQDGFAEAVEKFILNN